MIHPMKHRKASKTWDNEGENQKSEKTIDNQEGTEEGLDIRRTPQIESTWRHMYLLNFSWNWPGTPWIFNWGGAKESAEKLGRLRDVGRDYEIKSIFNNDEKPAQSFGSKTT